MIYKHPTAGFTLVEVLVAITVLLLVMVGPMRIMTQVNQSNTFSTDQTTAFFLAQEGLELVQLGRDNLVLGDLRDTFTGGTSAPNPWQEFDTVRAFDACIKDGATIKMCGLTPTATGQRYTVVDCSTNIENCRLYRANSLTARRYTHTTTNASSTPFTRTIQIALIPGASGRPQGAVATSTVTWRTGDLIASQKVELVTYLTNTYDTQ
jgi:prepilin-type N-terminal cleavage/methylation domain-containing protein